MLFRQHLRHHLIQESIEAQHAAYKEAHPEFTQLLADFVQTLLHQKPDDVFAFARTYFAEG